MSCLRFLWAHASAIGLATWLPNALRPQNTAAGHAIQAALSVVAGRPVIGWKIAATSAAGQAHVQVDGPLAGRILEGFVQPIGATLPLVGNRMRAVEPEFAFRMGSDMPPRATPYTVVDVMAAVASLHAAFELPDSRFADFASAGMAQLIADNACCGVFAFGPAAPPMWREVDLAAHRVHATVRGADGSLRYTRDGEGRALLADPRIALTWLANELSSLGIGLRAGDWAPCGTCMVPLAILPGDHVEADYGTFGRIAIAIEIGLDETDPDPEPGWANRITVSSVEHRRQVPDRPAPARVQLRSLHSRWRASANAAQRSAAFSTSPADWLRTAGLIGPMTAPAVT